MSDPYAEFASPVKASAGNDPYAEFAMPVQKPKTKPRQQDAVKALSDASAALDKQLAGLPEEARRIGRQKFNADPRIKDLVAQVNAGLPKEEPTTLGQLWDSTKQRGAALVKGIASLPDTVTEAVAGGMRLENKAVDTLGGLAMQAFGASPERIAAYHQAGAQADKALSRPATVRRGVENVVAAPTDTAGKIADFGTEMLGGALIPVPAVKTPPRAPVTVASVGTQGPKALVQEGKDAGVRILTSDVLPPKTFIGRNAQSVGEKIPFAGTGGVRAAQQAERVNAVKSVLREFGGDDAVKLFDDAPSAIDDVVADLAKTRSSQLSKLTADKTAVIEAAQGVVPVNNTIKAIDQQIARLQGLKTDKVKPVIAQLEDWKQAVQGQDLVNIEDLRKIMGEAFKAPELASIRSVGEKATNAIYPALRDDMGAFIKTASGDAAHSTWTNANAKLAGMAGELKNAAFRKVLNDAETTPENIAKILFSAKASDVRRLVSNLSPKGVEKARTAILQRAFDKAVSADGGLSVERFINNVKALGDPIGVAFSGADKARLEGLVRVLDATRRASAASVAPPTGVQNMPAVGGFALSSMFGNAAIPVAGLGGMFARGYESAPVRNMLLGLSKTAPGSKAEAAILQKLGPALAAANNNDLAAAASGRVGVPVAASDGEENE